MKSHGVEITTFSYSAVISYLADDIDGLFFILVDLVYLQLALAACNILFRGGIPEGSLIAACSKISVKLEWCKFGLADIEKIYA